jgi:hypothetical protein
MASLASATGAGRGKPNKYGMMKKNPRLAAARGAATVFNSTSSLYVSETLSQPNNKTTIRSVAEAVIRRMKQSMRNVAEARTSAATAAVETAAAAAAVSAPSNRAAAAAAPVETAAAAAAAVSAPSNRAATAPVETAAAAAAVSAPSNRAAAAPTAALPERWRQPSDHSIFDESAASAPPPVAPTPGQVEYVIRHIFKTGQLSVDCNIIALVYIDRLLATGMPLTVRNWRPVLAISMILASKVWDDLSMINDDFSTFLPFTLAELNKWEVKYLNSLSFNVRVKASEYARFYFNLREQQAAGSGGAAAAAAAGTGAGARRADKAADAASTPLNSKAAHKLEALSASAQARFEALYGAVPDSSGSIHNLAKMKIPRMQRSSSDMSKTGGGPVKKSTGRSVLS